MTEDSDVRSRVSAALISLLCVLALVPAGTVATHDIPHVWDETEIDGSGGYAAWRVQSERTASGNWPWLYLDLGEHAFPEVENASWAHVGLWLANFDHNYVWFSAVAAVDVNTGELHLQTAKPVSTNESANVTNDWSARSGGRLPLPPGDWLVLAFWATDGTIDADMALGSEVEGGEPLITLTNMTHGTAVFGHENGDFGGDINLHTGLSPVPFDDCAIYACGFPPQSGDVRHIENGHVSEDVERRLFGLFWTPGNIEQRSHWTGPQGGESNQTAYWFHGAQPGTYDFWVDENTDVGSPRLPVVAVGADVQIPR